MASAVDRRMVDSVATRSRVFPSHDRRGWSRQLVIACVCLNLPLARATSIEYCGTTNGSTCELLPVSESIPARLCSADMSEPPVWAWPFAELQLRLQPVDTDFFDARHVYDAPRLHVSVPPRGLCMLPMLSHLCKDCSKRCTQIAKHIGSTGDFAVTLPPRGGCVYFHSLPDGIHKCRAKWQLRWDPLVIVQALAGAALLSNAKALSESPMVHAAIGGGGSFIFISALALWWLTREVRGTVHGVIPFGRVFSALSMFLFAFVPAARNVLAAKLASVGVSDYIKWMDISLFNLPVGRIIFCVVAIVAVATAVFGARLSLNYFASGEDPTGEVPFYIAADGRRVDALPPNPVPQRMLAWIFFIGGLVLLLTCTHSDAWSAVFALVVFLREEIGYIFVRRRIAAYDLRPEDLRKLVPRAAAEEQARRTTAGALAALQQHLRSNMHRYHQFKPESELRLRRFSDGGSHFQMPQEVSDESRSRWSCTLL